MSAALGAVLGGSGSLLGGVTDLLNYYENKKNNERNYDLQKDKLRYDKNLQREIFNREDNSIQRRVADLTSAGLSPVLAAGSGAGAGSVVATTAPQKTYTPLNSQDRLSQLAMNAMQLMTMQQNIEQSQSQIELNKHQAKQADASVEQSQANATLSKTKAAEVAHNIKMNPETPTTGTSGLGAVVRDVENQIRAKVDAVIPQSRPITGDVNWDQYKDMMDRGVAAPITREQFIELQKRRMKKK